MSMQTSMAELLQEANRQQMMSVGTSTPGYVETFDPVTQLARLQIGIVRVRTDGTTYNPAPIIECPVQFSGGGGFAVEHQIDSGDEGIIIFSQRCIDAWVETGGIAENPILRFHDFADAYFIPGIRAKPNAIQAFSNDGIRLRNAAGDSFIHLKGDGTAEIKVTTLDVTGDITATGTINAPTIEADTSLTAAGAEVVSHTHGGIEPGGGTTAPLS
jgi:hypothetical protein